MLTWLRVGGTRSACCGLVRVALITYGVGFLHFAYQIQEKVATPSHFSNRKAQRQLQTKLGKSDFYKN